MTRDRAQFFRTRRRWGVIAPAFVLLAAAYAARVAPKVRSDGWPACIPTTALVLGLPLILSDYPPVGFDEPGAPVPMRLRDELYLDLLRNRAGRDELWSWQWSILVARCLQQPAETSLNQWSLHAYGPLAFVREAERQGRLSPRHAAKAARVLFVRVETRPRWPAHRDVYVRVHVKRWDARGWTRCRFIPRGEGMPAFEHTVPATDWSGGVSRDAVWDDGLIRLPPLEPGISDPEYDVVVEAGSSSQGPWVELGTRRLRVPIDGGPAEADAVRPVFSEAVAELLRDRIAVNVRIRRGLAYLEFGTTPPDDRTGNADTWRGWPTLAGSELWDTELAGLLASADGMTLGVRIELLRAGEIVFTGEAWWAPERAGGPLLRPYAPCVLLHPTNAGRQVPIEGPWEVRFRGDSVVALRNFAGQSCWAGEVVRPVHPVE